MFDANSEEFKHIIYVLTDQVAVFRKVTVKRNMELLAENDRYDKQIKDYEGNKIPLQQIHFMYLKEIKESIYRDVKSELSYLGVLQDAYNNSRNRIMEIANEIKSVEDVEKKKALKEELKILFSFVDTYEAYFKTLKSVQNALEGYDQNNDRYIDFIKSNPDTFKEANVSATASKNELKEKTINFDINISDDKVTIAGSYDNITMEQPNEYDLNNIEEMDLEYFFINFLDEISDKLNIKGTELSKKKLNVKINGQEIKNVDAATFVPTVNAYISNKKKEVIDKATAKKNKEDEINRNVPDKKAEKEKEQEVEEKKAKKVVTLDRIMADLTKGLDFEKGDDWKFTASNIRVNDNFKKKVCTGNKIYNIVALAPSVISYPFQLIKKGIAKVAYTKSIDERIQILEDRLRNLSEEELEIIYKQYKGGNLRNYQKMPIVNTMIQARIAGYVSKKVREINARMVQIYNTILSDFKRMTEITKIVESNKISYDELAELDQEYQARVYGKAALIGEYIQLTNEKLDYEIGGKVGFVESINAYKSGMSQAGFRFRAIPKEDEELNEKQAQAYEEEIRGVANNDDYLALEGFLKREKLLSESTILKEGFLMDRDVGLRSYNPLVKPLNYDKDPFVSDLMRTVVLVASGINLYTTVQRAHELELYKEASEAKDQIIKHQSEEIDDLTRSLAHNQELAQKITDKAGTVEAGRIAQINEANLAHTNTLERAVLDQTNWHSTGAEYKALDDAAHATYNNAYTACQGEINSIADQVANGTLSHTEAMAKLTDLSNSMESQFLTNYKAVYDTVKQYAENNPQFDLIAPTEGLEKVIQTNPNIAAGNAAVDEAFKLADEIIKFNSEKVSEMIAPAGEVTSQEVSALFQNYAKIEAAQGIALNDSMLPGLFNSLSAAALAIGVNTRMRKYTPYMDLDNLEQIDDITQEDLDAYRQVINSYMPQDIKNSVDNAEIARVIAQLNPNAVIQYDPTVYDRIGSSIPGDQLILPNGFYYNEKNGITNKHNTTTGLYTSIKVDSLKFDHIVADLTDNQKIYEIICQLNPGATIEYDPSMYDRIKSDVPGDQLILPDGFYYNEKNGITNKHNTTTGLYASIKVDELQLNKGR